MMESSEQPHCSIDPEDCSLEGQRVLVSNYEDCTSYKCMPLNQNDQVNEEIHRYMDNNPALILSNSQRIPLKGEHLTFAQNSKNEMIVLFNNMQAPSIEHALSQGFSVNSDNNPASAMQCGLNNLGNMNTEGIPVRRNDGLPNIDKNRTDSVYCSSEAVLQKEGTRQLVFFPRETKIMPLSNCAGFIELTGILRPATVMSEPSGEKATGSDSEGPVILSQTYIDSYSNKMEDRVSAANKENNNGLHEEYISSVVEISSPTMEEKLSMPPLDADLAVSVTHTAAPILDHDWRTKNILEDKKQTEETGQSKLALPTISPNVTYFEFSNLKEFLDSELFSESPLIEESSNHSDLKGDSDFSNKDDNANFTTSVVKKTVDEDNNEPIHFPSQLQSSESINSLDRSVDFDQSQNLESIFYPSLKKYKIEMDNTNSEGACPETQTCMERTFLSLGDNSKLKSSFFSDSSQSKDHNLHLLKKMKPFNPNEAKDMDVYDLETDSRNLEPELSDNSSLDRQCFDSVNPDEAVDRSKDIQLVNSNLEGATGNLTFQGILTAFTDNSKLNKNLTDGKNGETYYDNPQYSLDQDPQPNGEHSSREIAKNTPVKFCKNNQNSVFSETNCTNEEKICNENSSSVKNDVNIDNKSQEDTSIGLVLAAFDGIVVKPPQRTYARKKKTSESVGNIEFFRDDFYDNVSNSSPKIFSLDNGKEKILIDEDNLADEDGYVNIIPSNIKIRISSPVDESTISLKESLKESADQNLLKEIPDFVMDTEESLRESTCGMNIDNESKENDSILSNIAASDKLTVKAPQRTYARKKKTYDFVRNMEFSDFPNSEQCSSPKTFGLDEKKQVMIDGYSSADEDGYVNFMPSNIKIRISSPVDESAINLKNESLDQTLEEIPDFYMEPEDLGNICYGTYLIDPSFKTTCTKKTERDAPSASSPDFPKAATLKKKVQTLSLGKSGTKIDSYKRDKVIKSSIKMKDVSNDGKVKKKIKKTVGNSKNFSSSVAMVHHKRCQPSKDGVQWKRTVKTWIDRFLNDKTVEKTNCANEEFSDNFQYRCSHCNFVSSKVGNLIAHLKYYHLKPFYMTDNHTHDVRMQWSGSLSSSQNFSNGSVIHNQYTVSLPTTSEVLHMASEGRINNSQLE